MKADIPPVQWHVDRAPVAYPRALAAMDVRAAAIANGCESELVWLLEHPPIYTAGTSAKPSDLLEARFPVFKTGRGGQFTYHGPGQRVGYVMLDLNRRGFDVRGYVRDLESWLIETLATFGIRGERRAGRVGIWISHQGREDKIGAIGVRIRRGVTLHGISLNVNPDLSHFSGIVPCGVREHGVTSFADLGVKAGIGEIDDVLRETFGKIFGAVSY
ncbi:MAG: lipoyl(octanoyl) transferase LipB [Alphaproteobacteria bacterium]|nr:lipoyl(octanoyl) transferase LipB [Alphaproteobacteria bacterium]